jgi:transposase
VEHAAANEAELQKKSLIAAEQLRPDVAQRRAAFFASALDGVPIRDIVVLDESYATTKFTRLRGRSPRGQRLLARVPAGHWKLLTILAAMSLDGVVAAATIDAATDTDVFIGFIGEALCPALRRGQVVVMDNLPAHHAAGVRRLIEAAGCRLVYLPPYSPDFSPIEPMWSKLKQSIRSADARTIPALHTAIEHAFRTITPGDCHGYFQGCGYAIDDVKML